MFRVCAGEGTTSTIRSNISAPVYPSTYLLRMALGLVYFHFGLLKFFPDLSPAETLAAQTIIRLSWGWLDAHQSLLLLATMESALGVCFLMNIFPRLTFIVFLLHMLGTFAPIFVLPEVIFKISPFAPTLEGQYILKNLVFIAAGWTVLLPHVFPSLTRPVKAEGAFLVETVPVTDPSS